MVNSQSKKTVLDALDAQQRHTAMQVDRVHCCDALTLLRALPDGYVDLVVTSPPYNLRNSTGNGLKSTGGLWTNNAFIKGYSHHQDNMPRAQYVEWQRRVLAECLRILKPDGALFYNHKWRVQSGLLETPQAIVEEFPVRQIIIWDRGHGFNFNPGFFVPFYEVIYLIAKPDFRLARGANVMSDIWHIEPEQNKEHPNAFPVELALRCIESTDAQFVLDPFLGSGTTAVAARNLGRHYIGCDISPLYVEIARARLAEPYTMPMFETPGTDRTPDAEQLGLFE